MFTQGKWFNNGGRIYAQQGDDIQEICDVGMINHQSKEDTDNARLITAAPTLLEAAQEIVSDFAQHGEVLQLGDNGEYGTESAIGRLNTAINQANS